MYFVYILYSLKLEKYYVGSTNDIERRLLEHNRGKTVYSKNGKPWELKYVETYQTRSEAIKRENYIKNRKSKIYIENLINSNGSEHPA